MSKGGVYRHFKGGTYVVIGEALHTETDEELVIYMSTKLDGKFWCRPKEMFYGYTKDGIKRFTLLED